MKKGLLVWGIGWGTCAALVAVGGRTLWFGLTPGTGVADVVAASASALALILVGFAAGTAANGLSHVLTSATGK